MTGKMLPVSTSVLLLLVILLALLLGLGRGFISRPPVRPLPDSGMKLKVGNASLWAEVVTTPAQIERGLSGRPFLLENEGLLFVFGRPGLYPFWMKEMHFPLDFVWIDVEKKVVGVTENVMPESYPQSFRPPTPVSYVLEVNAGWATGHGVKVGDAVSF